LNFLFLTQRNVLPGGRTLETVTILVGIEQKMPVDDKFRGGCAPKMTRVGLLVGNTDLMLFLTFKMIFMR
jgi:hypothetical protein